MDNLVFEESINSEITSSEFVDKQWLYVNDNNNASYSGQIVLDTTSLANSGSYINWSEAFLSFPMVLQMNSASANMVQAAPLDFMMGLKSGGWNIIHSLTCEFNNGSIIQQVPFKNVFCGFKNLTSWSQDDLKNWGMVAGFYPDTCDSWLFNNCAVGQASTNILATGGVGLCNNRNAPYIQITGLQLTAAYAATNIAYSYNSQTIATMPRASVRRNWNKGLFKRQSWLNFNLYTQDGGALNVNALQYSNQGVLLGSSAPYSTAAGYANNVNYASGSGFGLTFTGYIQANDTNRAIIFDNIVRLKDVEDFFAKCPLLKGSTMRIYINTNQVYLQGSVFPATYTANSGLQATYGAIALTAPPVILGGGGTCPVMLSSVDLGQGSQNLSALYSGTGGGGSMTGMVAVGAGTAALQTFTCGLSIVKTQFSQFGTNTYSAPITSVRLYAPAYMMSPLSEERYLSLNATHKVIYDDIFQFSFPNISVGNTFNFLVSNGIPNIKGVLVCPLISQGYNGVAGVANTLIPTAYNTSTLLSPFCGTGSHPDPINIGNFQIQISGKNLFINQLQYGYEQFVEQVAMSNQLNGNLTTSLTSGLIGYEEWTNLYRYYYGYAARSIPSEEGVAKAVQVLGQNNASVPIDLFVYVIFERELTIDVRTGARIG